jgi:hypothetical protein
MGEYLRSHLENPSDHRLRHARFALHVSSSSLGQNEPVHDRAPRYQVGSWVSDDTSGILWSTIARRWCGCYTLPPLPSVGGICGVMKWRRRLLLHGMPTDRRAKKELATLREALFTYRYRGRVAGISRRMKTGFNPWLVAWRAAGHRARAVAYGCSEHIVTTCRAIRSSRSCSAAVI